MKLLLLLPTPAPQSGPMKKKTSSIYLSNNVPKEKDHLNSSPKESSRLNPRKIVPVGYLLILLVVFAVGAFLGSKILRSTSNNSNIWANKEMVELKSGPWGQVGYFPITLVAQEELLNPRETENTAVKWTFQGFTPATFSKFLEDLGLSNGQREAMLQSMNVFSNGLIVIPPRDVVLNLPSHALTGIYQILSKSQQNQLLNWTIWKNDFDSYKNLGVSNEVLSLFKKFSVEDGNFWVCYAMPYVLQGIPAYEDKVVFLKALSQQKTMLVKLHVSPNTNIEALSKYWGKAFWKSNVSSLLEAMKRSPDGGNLDIIELLPPFATSLLYTYPIPQNGLNGPIITKNCSWTAFNFFRDIPDSGFSNDSYVLAKLKTDYYPIQSDPQYGDVVVFLSPSGAVLHAATYIAEDIAYSKNGSNNLHPWVLSKISELTEGFSYGLAPGQQLKVLYFRNKYY